MYLYYVLYSIQEDYSEWKGGRSYVEPEAITKF